MRIDFRKRTAGAILLAALLLLPLAASAGIGDILSLLVSIRRTLTGVGQALSSIGSIEAEVRALEQQVIWPERMITGARASIGPLRARFSRPSHEIPNTGIGSATLANTSRLDELLRRPGARDLNQLASSYAAVYLALPEAGKATESQRKLIDVDDSFALEVLKAASISDQAGEFAINSADRLEKEAAVAAPGSAGILAAAARASELAAQAMLQKMLAAQLRQEAALLAHQNALRKQSAESLKQLRNNLVDARGSH